MTRQTLIVAGPPALVQAVSALLASLPDTTARVSRRDPAGRAERLVVTTSTERATALASALHPILQIELDLPLHSPQPVMPSRPVPEEG